MHGKQNYGTGLVITRHRPECQPRDPIVDNCFPKSVGSIHTDVTCVDMFTTEAKPRLLHRSTRAIPILAHVVQPDMLTLAAYNLHVLPDLFNFALTISIGLSAVHYTSTVPIREYHDSTMLLDSGVEP